LQLAHVIVLLICRRLLFVRGPDK